MKAGLTELVFVIDRSGSMHSLTDDTVGGFNSMIEKQKKEPGECLVSMVLFNHDTEVVYDRVPLDKVEPLTADRYCAGGTTALLDALGGAIHHIGNVHKYAREEDVPEKTMVVVTTDGYENASRLYSSDKVKDMVKKEQEKYGWEFLFLGANIDAVETAASYGFRRDRAVEYRATSRGQRAVYESVNDAVCCMRESRAIGADWDKAVRDEKIDF